jgi:asparagine synthase (glutamine-hydrolysing)
VDPAASAQVITRSFEGYAHGNSLERALKTDLQCYLSDDVLTLTDRLSMWHSLELRVPYLDHRFVEDMMTLPPHLKVKGTNQKHLLKKVAANFLPEEVINHRKQGFEAPMGQWLRGPLRGLMEDTLSAGTLAREGIFDSAQVERLKLEHLLGRRKHSKLLFSLLMFQLWKAHHTRLPQAGSQSQLRPMRSGTA